MTREDLARELKSIDPGKKYFAITLLGTADGKMHWSACSHWVGWVDGKPGREIREASLVNASRMAETWAELGEGHLVVNSTTGLLVYARFGGNALVAKDIGEKYFSNMICAQETAYAGAVGFKPAASLPPHVFKRAPRPKHRMHIIQRDRYRCKICGRRPDDYTDIELHVHHVRPWEKGGLTEDENLVTLCDTCHDGLQPHEELSLFQLLDPDAFNPSLSKRLHEYREGVRLYRDFAKGMLSELENCDNPRDE
jgi:hypothetical protein